MPHLVYYHRETGEILGVWNAAERELLMANMQEGDAEYGYVLCEGGAPGSLQERYEVREERVMAREELVLLATPPRFAADGGAACVIRPVPFVPCTLLITTQDQEHVMALTPGDEYVLITTNTPQSFLIRLQPMAGYWARPIVVGAV